jgi:hypothetical protein
LLATGIAASTWQIDNSAGVLRIFRPGALYHNLSSTLSDWNTAGRDLDTRIQGDTDANTFYLDASTDRVGIGTATPAAKLHVASTGSTNLYVDGAVAGQSNLILAANGTPQWYFGRQATTHNFFLYNNTDGVDFIYMTPIAGGTGLITINDDASNIDTIIRGDTDTNLLYVDASTDRVGIGTATPAVKLDVTGEARVSTAGTNAASVVTVGGTQTLTAKTLTSPILTAGTASAGTAPLKLTSGTNLTTDEAGVFEYDGTSLYFTDDATNGRGMLAPEHFFYMSADGTDRGTSISDLFGSNTGVPYVAAARYLVEAWVWYTRTTAGTVVFTLTSTTNYVNVNGMLYHSPGAGILANSTSLNISGFEGTTGTTAAAFVATASQTVSTTQAGRMWWVVETNASTGGNFRIRVTNSAGVYILQRGSYFTVKRLPTTNTGIFVA